MSRPPAGRQAAVFSAASCSGKLQMSKQLRSDFGDAFAGGIRHRLVFCGTMFSKYQPNSGTMNIWIVTNCAGKLRYFHTASRKLRIQKRSRFVQQILESL